MSLAANIRTLRTAAHMTQGELGARVGVGQGAVSKWESGESKPKASDLPTIALAVGTTIDRLVQGADAEYDALTSSVTGDDTKRQDEDGKDQAVASGTIKAAGSKTAAMLSGPIGVTAQRLAIAIRSLPLAQQHALGMRLADFGMSLVTDAEARARRPGAALRAPRPKKSGTGSRSAGTR